MGFYHWAVECDSVMMDAPLTITAMLRRAVDLYGSREVITKQANGSIHRYTYDELYDRVCQLANGLERLGIGGDARVAVAAENNYRHLELYFGLPCSGRSIHMCNHRLPDDHFQYIVNDAGDEALFVDPEHLAVVEDNAHAFEMVEQYVVLGEEVPETDLEPVVAYEELLADESTDYEWPAIDEDRESGMCYTSGTTGKPKGCSYSHRAMWLHSLMLGHTDTFALGEGDTVMPVVPMFHVNGWGLPYAAPFSGADLVLPGGHADPASIGSLIDDEDVTLAAAVPTIWLELADHLDEQPALDISSLERITIGGSAPPESLIRRYDEAFDAPIVEVWGMTETTPIGTVSALREELTDLPADDRYTYRAKAGIPVPGVEVRVRDEDGSLVPRDGEATGELEVRGPWIVDEYHDRPEATAESFTDDGWFKTGDIATMDEWGYVDVVDRKNDVIKSGGEWISSVELENELMAHEAVAEAAVIGVSHEKWRERPVACVVLSHAVDDVPEQELLEFLGEAFPNWWLPDRIEAVGAIPKTSTNKFDKKVLRERFDDLEVEPDREAPETAES